MKKRNILVLLTALLAFGTFVQAAYRPEYVLTQKDKEAIDANLPSSAAAKPKKARKILVFDKTTSFRHYEGISAAKYLLEKIGKDTGAWSTVISNDLSNFEWPKIKEFDCIVMNNTTGAPFSEPDDVLEKMPQAERDKIAQRNSRLRDNLLRYVSEGGGLFGIHAAADTYRIRNKDRYEPYLQMLGGDFIGHPWTSNMTEVISLEDADSAITKGLWKRHGIIVNDEIYMMGDIFDRGKLRVLLSLDADRTPVKAKIREDKDIPVIWIKTYGKGRVAYGGFGHSQRPYTKHRDINETYMRLVQFCCGDLAADTSPLEKPARLIAPKLFDRPTMDDVRKFKSVGYDPAAFVDLDGIVFAFYAYNDLEDFNNEMAQKLLNELASGEGTARYRALLAQLLDATGAKVVLPKLRSVLSSERDAAVKDRLAALLAREEGKTGFVGKVKAYAPPKEKPASDRDIMRAIIYLRDNPQTAIPAWLGIASLPNADMKAALMRALTARGVDAAEVLALKPESAEMFIARLEAAVKSAKPELIKKAFEGAELLSSDKKAFARAAVVAASAKGGSGALLDIIVNTSGAQADLAAEALSQTDISNTKAKLLSDLPKLDPAKRKSVVKVLASFPDNKTFCDILAYLPSEADTSVKNEIYKLLVRCSQEGVDPEMFAAVEKAYAASKNDADKRFLLRFAPMSSSPQALALCAKAATNGTVAEACRYLGQWKNRSAASELIKIAKSAKDERSKTYAHSALENLFSSCAPDAESFSYAYDAFAPGERQKLVKIALDKPDKAIAQFLRDKGDAASADAILKKISEAKPTLSSSANSGGTSAALDGNIKSRWSSGTAIKPGMWVMLDFGFSRELSSLEFDSAFSKGDFPTKVRILAGDSATALVPVAADISVADNKLVIKFPQPLNARCVKILSLDDSSRWWSIHEVLVK